MSNTHDEIYSMLGELYEPAQAEQWLDSPQILLGGSVPRTVDAVRRSAARERHSAIVTRRSLFVNIHASQVLPADDRKAFEAWISSAYPNIYALRMGASWLEERWLLWQDALAYARTPQQAPSGGQEGGGNWTEDFAHENGNYQCSCTECGCIFLGHKRRIVCKACASPPAQAAEPQAAENPAWAAGRDGRGIVAASQAVDEHAARHAALILEWFEGRFDKNPSEHQAAWNWLRQVAGEQGKETPPEKSDV